MSPGPPERLEFSRPVELPGVDVLLADHCPRVWRWYHETYTVCTGLRSSRVVAEWVYRRKTHLAGPGTLSLMEPGEIHFNPRMPGLATFRVVLIDPAVVERAAQELGIARSRAPHLRVAELDDPALFEPFARLHTSLERLSTLLERQSRFAACLRLLLEQCVETARPSRRGGCERPAIERARELIHERYAEHLPLDQLAAAAGVSRFHLVRAFKDQLAMPPHAYQIGLRIARARILLRAGATPAEAAAALGFADQSHLTRHFRRILGITPGTYVRATGRSTARTF